MEVKQIIPFVWLEGEHRPIAELNLQPAELTRRFGFVWEEGWDDLDEYRRATIELVDGSEVKLVHYPYLGERGAGTVVYTLIDADWDRVRALVLETLDLPQSAYTWIPELTVEDRIQELERYLAYLEETEPNARADMKQYTKRYLARLKQLRSESDLAEEQGAQ